MFFERVNGKSQKRIFVVRTFLKEVVVLELYDFILVLFGVKASELNAKMFEQLPLGAGLLCLSLLHRQQMTSRL